MNWRKSPAARKVVILLCIFGLAASFRFFGLNWDHGQHLHPDERFLTMVIPALHWPKTIGEYLDTEKSPLSPFNAGYGFYVYGLWPAILVKLVASIGAMDTYDGILHLGRYVTAYVDVLVTVCVFAIAYATGKNHGHHAFRSGAIAAFCYATMALPIQLAHFFTVDPYLTFASTLVLLMVSLEWFGVPLGIALGLAVSAKISAVLIMPAVAVAYVIPWWNAPKKKRLHLIGSALLCAVSAALVTRLTGPHMFSGGGLIPTAINPQFIQSIKDLKSYDVASGFFPPAVQWGATIIYLYPIMQLVFFGIGIPHVLALTASVVGIVRHRKYAMVAVPMVFALTVFGYQGAQFVKVMRYFYPVYPALAVIMGMGCAEFMNRKWKYSILIPLVIWPYMVITIYGRDNTRIAASKWIYTHIPEDRVISSETWDDGLPLRMEKYPVSYTSKSLPITGADSPEKEKNIREFLDNVDYVFLTSNRAYGSMLSLPIQFPVTTRYYKDLFAEKLGFRKVAEFSSHPTFPVPGIRWCIRPPWFSYGEVAPAQCSDDGISVIDDYADESWTVYDHPKVTIFEKIATSASDAAVLKDLESRQ